MRFQVLQDYMRHFFGIDKNVLGSRNCQIYELNIL